MIRSVYLYILCVPVIWVQALLNRGYAITHSFHVAHIYYTTSIPSAHQLDQDTVRALDLDLVLQYVSQYTVTRRGKDAFLYLVGINSHAPWTTTTPASSTFNRGSSSTSRKKLILSTLRTTGIPQLDSFGKNNPDLITTTPVVHLVPIAQSLQQAQAEYTLVQEALFLLQMHSIHPFEDDDGRAIYNSLNDTKYDEITLPPMYDAGIPDHSSRISHQDFKDDYDEWLYPIMRFGLSESSLTLEYILQAEQLVLMSLRTFRWGTLGYAQTHVPGLCSILSKIQVQVLEPLYQQIAGTVVIVQGEKSYLDPLGTKVCTLYFDGSVWIKSNHSDLLHIL